MQKLKIKHAESFKQNIDDFQMNWIKKKIPIICSVF